MDNIKYYISNGSFKLYNELQLFTFCYYIIDENILIANIIQTKKGWVYVVFNIKIIKYDFKYLNYYEDLIADINRLIELLENKDKIVIYKIFLDVKSDTDIKIKEFCNDDVIYNAFVKSKLYNKKDKMITSKTKYLIV